MADVFATDKVETPAPADNVEKRLQDKDAFIETLKLEAKTAREAAAAAEAKSLKTDTILEEIRNEMKRPLKAEGDTARDAVVDENKIRDLVKSTISSEEAQRVATQNTKAVTDVLSQHYGDLAKAQDAIRKVASDLGVSVEYLRDVGTRSPQALYKMLSVSPVQKVTPVDNARSIVNTQHAPQDPNSSELASLNQLRKTDPYTFWNVVNQKKYHDLMGQKLKS